MFYSFEFDGCNVSLLLCAVTGIVSVAAFLYFSLVDAASRRSIRLSRVAVSAFGLCIFGLFGISMYKATLTPPPPTLGGLKDLFPAVRPHLEELRQMSDADPEYMLIDMGHVKRPDRDRQSGNDIFYHEDPHSPMRNGRWQQYHDVLVQLAPRSRLWRSASGDVRVNVYEDVWKDRYTIVGYSFCRPTPTEPLWNEPAGRDQPCGPGKTSLDQPHPDEDGRRSKFEFIELGQGWFATSLR